MLYSGERAPRGPDRARQIERSRNRDRPEIDNCNPRRYCAFAL